MVSFNKINLENIIIQSCIALLLNAFIHKLTQTINSHYEYNINKKRSIQMLFVIGLLILIINKLIDDKSIKIDIDNNIIKGFKYGAILILISAFLNQWSDLNDSIKTVLLGGILFTIIYISNKKFKNKE